MNHEHASCQADLPGEAPAVPVVKQSWQVLERVDPDSRHERTHRSRMVTAKRNVVATNGESSVRDEPHSEWLIGVTGIAEN